MTNVNQTTVHVGGSAGSEPMQNEMWRRLAALGGAFADIFIAIGIALLIAIAIALATDTPA